MVASESVNIELVLTNDHEGSLILDGRTTAELLQADVIQIKRGVHTFQLVTFEPPTSMMRFVKNSISRSGPMWCQRGIRLAPRRACRPSYWTRNLSGTVVSSRSVSSSASGSPRTERSGSCRRCPEFRSWRRHDDYHHRLGAIRA
jgi:hypothetical protein